MTAAAWACDSCHTNNLAQARECRVCHRTPGSSIGQANQVPNHQEQVRQQSAVPAFVDSRYGTPLFQQTGPPPELPRITLTGGGGAMPAPPARDAPRQSRAALWLVAIGVILVVVLMLALTTDLSKIFSSGPTTPADVSTSDSSSGGGSSGSSGSSSDVAAAQGPRPTPCPDAVATWLAGGGTGSVLVAGYLTDRHVVTICRDSSGQLHYDGQVRDTAPSSQTHISLDATATPTGFTATNKGYLYQITDNILTVTNDHGAEILRATLTRTGP